MSELYKDQEGPQKEKLEVQRGRIGVIIDDIVRDNNQLESCIIELKDRLSEVLCAELPTESACDRADEDCKISNKLSTEDCRLRSFADQINRIIEHLQL